MEGGQVAYLVILKVQLGEIYEGAEGGDVSHTVAVEVKGGELRER